MTNKEKQLIDLLLFRGYNKKDIIAISLVARNDNTTENVLNFVKENKNIDFEELFDYVLNIKNN